MKALGKIVGIVLLLAALFYAAVYIGNNLAAAGLERRLLAAELPGETRIVESRAVAGKMLGNGNGMQWFGILLVQSEQSAQELLAWYAQRVQTDAGREEIYVDPQETPLIFGEAYPDQRFRQPVEPGCYQVCLMRDSAVGAEESLWEALLNCDVRAH